MTIQDPSMTIEPLDAVNWRVSLPNISTRSTGQCVSLVMHMPRNPALTVAQVRSEALAQAIGILTEALAEQRPATP